MRQTAILGGLLAVALVASYWTWTHPEDDNDKATDVIAVRIDASALQKVVWKDEKKTVTATHPSDGSGAWVALEVSETTVDKSKPPTEVPPAIEADTDASDTDKPAAPEAPPAPTITTVTRFVGNEQAGTVWEAFAPLYALRQLQHDPAAGLAAYGLDAPKATLELTTATGTTTVQVGGEAYGTRDRYVLVDSVVYLLDDETLRPFEFAKTRLVERGLFPFKEEQIEQVAVKFGDQDRAFTQKNASDRPKAYWADAGAPEERDVEATGWLGKVFRLRVKDYIADADAPTGLTPVFAYQVKGRTDAESAWTIEVLEVTVDGAKEYYARTSFNRGLVSLTKSLAEEAVADLSALFDGKKVEEAPAEPEADPNAPPSAVPAGAVPAQAPAPEQAPTPAP